mgnify:CR=1 FL=1
MILLQTTATGMSSLIMFAMIFAVMYFFMIRPQIRKQKKESEFRSKLKKGDKIVTIGGIHGKIINLKEDSIIIEVHGGTTLKVERKSISMSGKPGTELK